MVGLGFEFLCHIERTKVMIHIVDAASVEGRDPIDDIYKINAERKPIILRDREASAGDCCQQDRYLYEGENDDAITLLREEFERRGSRFSYFRSQRQRSQRTALFMSVKCWIRSGMSRLYLNRNMYR